MDQKLLLAEEFEARERRQKRAKFCLRAAIVTSIVAMLSAAACATNLCPQNTVEVLIQYDIYLAILFFAGWGILNRE